MQALPLSGEIDAAFQNSWTQYELRAVWREKTMSSSSSRFRTSACRATSARLTYETIGLINEQLWIGHFELWAGSGLLVFTYMPRLLEQGGHPVLRSTRRKR